MFGWCISAFIIFWAMIGYPISLVIIDKALKRKNEKDDSFEPTVTIMVVAHNEEKVIEEKLCNLLKIQYPIEKLKFVITSDYSTDSTNEIVEAFIMAHPERSIRLHKAIEHKGKTNAQNEAQKLCDTEILVMTDANAMFEPNAVRELVSFFTDTDVAYVSGKLAYKNTDNNGTANSEGFYWKLDLLCRGIESRIQTITAGNGAIYAVRNADYVDIPPIECHDSSFPVIYSLEHKRALYNPDAVAYEKAGEVDEDEFKRKVRMNRIILRGILPSVKILNFFSYRWFSFFYFGHRTCRYLLWIAHLLVLLLNIPLAFDILFWRITLGFQVLFYGCALMGWATKSTTKILKILAYYCMTVVAQWKGVINIVTGKSKPVWEKAESTR